MEKGDILTIISAINICVGVRAHIWEYPYEGTLFYTSTNIINKKNHYYESFI